MTLMVSRSGRHLQRYNMGRRQVVGCIPYRYKREIDGEITNELELLVISSQKGQKYMFPKGGWELDETLEEAACRESLEEAGVVGQVESELGQWEFLSKRHGTPYEGYMFPLFVKEQLEFWPEKNVRQRIWLSVDDAKQVCEHWWMKEAVEILVERLTSNSNNLNEDEEVAPCTMSCKL